MNSSSGFLFVACQVGAEPALKAELAAQWPDFRFAYSRPGFVTFKLPPEHKLPADFDLRAVFARAYGFSLGKVSGHDPQSCALAAARLAQDCGLNFDRLHVWQRDQRAPGDHGFEPGETPAAAEARTALLKLCAATVIADDVGTGDLGTGAVAANDSSPPVAAVLTDATLEQPPPTIDQGPAATASNRTFGPAMLENTHPGQLILDCIVVDPNQWWIGYHRASAVPSRWPGGLPGINRPERMISRAYLKLEEALRWSRMPVQSGDQCAEIGSAPGGASQALLSHGLQVLGVDPADMDPRILGHDKFTHFKMRGADVRRKEFRDVRWLTADINVAPNYTLDTVEAILSHAQVNVRGMLLTLKFLEWKLADELPDYIARVKSWGFADVRVRQLAHNRQEVCLAALRERNLRKGGRRPS